jgi:branched-chain amino acid transport system permease protein
MNPAMFQPIAIGLGTVLVLALVPLYADGYGLSLGIGILSYAVLATAWAMFSGPTRYISLATVAFFGVGAYTVAVVGELLPWSVVLAVAGFNGVLLAIIVGLSTLRLAGAYFVIFTFGLTELIRQLVTWYEVNVTRTIGRYVFLDITQAQIYWQLLALAAVLFLAAYLIERSRLGFMLRIIGGDEVVARHVGVDVARVKVALFALSALFMTLTGAIMAPRWTYIDPAIAFNPVVSFQVVIMALLGGLQRLWGPLLGVIPLTLLFEYLNAYFPNHFSLMLGLVFLAIVYVLPKGVAGLLAQAPRTRDLIRRLRERTT